MGRAAERALLRRMLSKIEFDRQYYMDYDDEYGDGLGDYEDGVLTGLDRASDILRAELNRIGGSDA